MKLKTRLTKTIQEMKTGELTRKNGFPYSQKTCKFYSDIINSLRFKEKDTLRDIQDQLQKRGASSVTERNYINSVKILLEKIGFEYKDIKVKVFEPTIHIPDPDRVWEMIKNFKPESKQESWAFRYMVAEFLTSARYKDLSKLNQSNIQGEYLVYQQTKTGKKVTIPITETLRNQFSETDNLLPKIPYSSLLRYVKLVYKKAGFTRDISTTKMVSGQLITITMKEYEAFGTHRLRGSAITGMLQTGMTEREVKQISGHSPMSNSFSRYVEFSQNHMNEKYKSFAR